MAHWQDIGGVLNGVTTDIYAEGLQIPFVKYHQAGVLNDEIKEFILMNVRRRDRAVGDLEAQLSACWVGVKHLQSMLKRFGVGQWQQCIQQIMHNTEFEARAAVKTMPDGVYEAESFMDDDAVDLDQPVPIRVKVTDDGGLESDEPASAGFFQLGCWGGLRPSGLQVLNIVARLACQ